MSSSISTSGPPSASKPTLTMASLTDPELDLSQLNPNSPELIKKQATMNIGTIGHVAHGKSTIVTAISGIRTNRHQKEQQRNITIQLGYANAKLYERADLGGIGPGANYKSTGSLQVDERDPQTGTYYHIDRSGIRWNLVRHVSFVDCPGHDILMATMLSGAAVMDAALLLIAGNISCPQPQTSEHLAAVMAMNLKHVIILQNKIDLVKPEQAKLHYQDIKRFVHMTKAMDSPIIPISAVKGIGVNVVVEALCKYIPIPLRDFTAPPILTVIRSFEVNKPGQKLQDVVGGVAGGSILRGVFRLGDHIEVRPGLIKKKEVQRGNSTVTETYACQPYFSTIVSLKAETSNLDIAAPGGLIGVGTNIDPTFTRSNRLIGMIVGRKGQLPDVYNKIRIKYRLLRRLLGVRQEEGSERKITPLRTNEIISLTIGSQNETAKILEVEGSYAVVFLNQPVCTGIGERISIQRIVNKKFRLIGLGIIESGDTLEVLGPIQGKI